MFTNNIINNNSSNNNTDQQNNVLDEHHHQQLDLEESSQEEEQEETTTTQQQGTTTRTHKPRDNANSEQQLQQRQVVEYKLKNETVFKLVDQSVGIIALDCGYQIAHQSSLDILNDICCDYIRKISTLLRISHETEEFRDRESDFVDSLERVFHQINVPSVANLHQFICKIDAIKRHKLKQLQQQQQQIVNNDSTSTTTTSTTTTATHTNSTTSNATTTTTTLTSNATMTAANAIANAVVVDESQRP